MSDNLTNVEVIREYLLSRTGNHPEDIRQANAIADEIERLGADAACERGEKEGLEGASAEGHGGE